MLRSTGLSWRAYDRHARGRCGSAAYEGGPGCGRSPHAPALPPVLDYYPIINQVTEGNHFSHDPLTWLELKSNEHTVTLPALVYAANAIVSHGDNRVLSTFSLVLLTLCGLFLILLLPEEIRRQPLLLSASGLVIGLLVFNLVQSHNVVMGFSGTIWFLSNMCALAAIVSFTWSVQKRAVRWAWCAAVLGLAGALSYSTNMSLWPALLVGALLLKAPRRHTLIIVGAGVLVLGLFFATYHTPPWHPPLNTTHNVTLAEYVATYMGGLAFSTARLAAIYGAFVLVGAGLLIVAVLRSRDRSLQLAMAPWIMVQVYALGNCLGTAVGRSGWGPGQALSSRYASLPVLFWAATLVELTTLLWHRRMGSPAAKTARALGMGLLVATLVLPMEHDGLARYSYHLQRAARLPLAELALRYHVSDKEAALLFIPWPPHLAKSLPFLRATKHIPFDKPPDPSIGHLFSPGCQAAAGRPRVDGRATTLERLSRDVARVRGFAVPHGEQISEIVIVGSACIVRGKAFPGFPIPPSARGSAGANDGFHGYVHTVPGETLFTYVRCAPSGRWSRLEGPLTVPEAQPGRL